MRRAADAEVLAVLHRHNASPYSAVGNGQLLDRVPEPLRLVHYTRRAIPAEYAASFGYYHRKIGDVHLDGLPEPMQRELMFVVWRIVELGGRVPCGPLGLLARELAATAARLRDQGQPGSSLLDRTPAQWRTELATTWARRTKALPNPNTLRTIAGPLDRACKLLWFGYDQSPWWRREVWDPVMDDRIPRRDHEPISNTVHWHRIDPAWLRLAAMWQLKTLLETDRLRWATVETRHSAMVVFSRWVRSRGLDSPLLCDDPAQLRPLMLDLLDDIRSAPGLGRCRAGQRRAPATVAAITAAVRGLYAFIHDHREDAARATGDRRWLELGPEYLRFWRPMDMPRKQRRHFDERHLFSDRALAQISQHAHRLGQPRSAGGLGDPQGMRLLLLMIATGRRVNELCMLDVHPIIPVAASSRGDAGVAKLRYQQTKIAGAPDTIFVDNEVVEDHRRAAAMAVRAPTRHRVPGRTALPVRPTPAEPPRPAALRGLPVTAPAARVGHAGRPARRRSAVANYRHPPVPPHQGDQPAQRRGPAARRPALPRPHLAGDVDALRADPRRHRESRVPALSKNHN